MFNTCFLLKAEIHGIMFYNEKKYRLEKEIDLKREKKRAFLAHLNFPIVMALIALLIVCLVIVIPNIGKTARIERFIDKNMDVLQKLISYEIDISEMKDQSLIKSVDSGCNRESCFTRFDTGAKGFASNSCYTGFYYSEKDLNHKYEYNNRIIEEVDSKNYMVKEETGDNILYLTKIREHWYYFESCY